MMLFASLSLLLVLSLKSQVSDPWVNSEQTEVTSDVETDFHLRAELLAVKDLSKPLTLALMRWLSPHPTAILRDEERRPLCSSPFDVNHALWQFTKVDRPDLTDGVVLRNSDCHPDVNSILSEKTARIDLIDIRTLKTHMDCTVIDDEILETITIPF